MDVVRWELIREGMMIVDVIRQASFIEIQRSRRLPFPGRVLVKIGDAVEPDDVVAEGSIPDDFVVIDLCEALGVPLDEVSSCLVRDEGELVQEGDILAQSEGAIERVVRAPGDGIIVDFSQGDVILAMGEHNVQVKAGMVGVVDDVIPEIGVLIKARGTLQQGFWGNGKFGSGQLFMVEGGIDQPLALSHLDTVKPGQVVAAGICLDGEVLNALAGRGVNGIILGVLSPSLINIAQELSIPLMVLQGFGDFPPDQSGFELMKSREGSIASINACHVEPASGQRPEVILIWEDDKLDEDLGFRSELLPGRRVQVNSGAYWGKMGVIIDLPKTLVDYESGLLAFPAVVQLDDEEVISVPSQNLVIIN